MSYDVWNSYSSVTNVLFRKKHHGHMKKQSPQTILILAQAPILIWFFTGNCIPLLLQRGTHTIDLTKLNRTPIIACGALLAGRMTAWCSVIQMIILWIVKEPSAIKQVTVGVFVLSFSSPYPVIRIFCFIRILKVDWQNILSRNLYEHGNFTRLNKIDAIYEVSVHWWASEDRKNFE